MRELEIPYSAEHVTSQWLTDALASTGVITSSTVASFGTERLGEGQGFVGQIVRLSLTYDSGEDGAPQSIIAKFPSTDPAIRSMLNELRLFEREVRFYKEVAPLIELSTPQCYYGATDGEAGDHVLLLEDLAPARVGDNVAGCSDEDAKLAIREIAGFHAAFWESPRLAELEWMSSFRQDADMTQERYSRHWDLFVAKMGAFLPPYFFEIAQRFGDNVASTMGHLAESPPTITHGDYRLDNMFFGTPGSGRPLTVFDWQVPMIGPGVADVAYFVAFCIDPERRRATEMVLLRAYHSAVLEHGVSGYDFERCLLDYRLSLLYYLTRAVDAGAMLDFSSTRGQQLARAIFERLDSALTDHNVAELMPG
jgi:aminoglycoside/choline kinase family phosphotransferase